MDAFEHKVSTLEMTSTYITEKTIREQNEHARRESIGGWELVQVNVRPDETMTVWYWKRKAASG